MFKKSYKQTINYIANTYMLWRIKPTNEEMRSYNNTERVLLTFDDFADERRTVDLLKVLDDYHVKAAFFVVGSWSIKNKVLVNRILDRGHWIGNHTFSHVNLKKLSNLKVVSEIEKGQHAKLLRPPFGAYDSRIRDIANSMGYKIAFWTIDTKDWQGISATSIKDRVMLDLHPGACILMHMNGPNTLEALPLIINGIRSRGYELCVGEEIDL